MLQVVNPPLRMCASIHDQSFAALKNLVADYVRFVPLLPYPRLGVEELEPPANGKTSWDLHRLTPLPPTVFLYPSQPKGIGASGLR